MSTQLPQEPRNENEKRRYRVVLWFDASEQEAARYADALDRVWDEHHGITSMQSQLSVLVEQYSILAEPIKRTREAE